MRKLLQALALALLLPAGLIRADSLILPASADTSLFEQVPDNNLGASLNLPAGLNNMGTRARELIRFDIAGSIPSNAIITSAALTVNVVQVADGVGVPSTFDLRRVLAGWTEGLGSGKQGSPANDGEVTWNNRIAPSTPWSQPGGAISNDFSGDVSTSVFINAVGSYVFGSASNTVADVQFWLANPSSNFGWVIITESENVMGTLCRFGAREDPTNAPSLAIEFTVPVVPVIQNVQAVGGQFQFSFSAQAGQPYTVQYTSSLDPAGWLTLTNVPAQPATTNIAVFDSLSAAPQRFYRVMTQY